jgi:hypothetical protein
MTYLSRIASALGLLVLAGALTGCDEGQPNSQQRGQAITEAYSVKLENARPYPMGQMFDSAERANLIERLLRMNNPNKIGYVYEFAMSGQIIQHYTIKGKVSSTASQLTNTHNIVDMCSGSYCPVAVDSMGDDGSYGPEEGGENGIFFFTTNGVLVEYNGIWLYSDAPLGLSSAPLIKMDANAQPTTRGNVLGTAPQAQPVAPKQP